MTQSGHFKDGLTKNGKVALQNTSSSCIVNKMPLNLRIKTIQSSL
jgi:hypothetical protein